MEEEIFDIINYNDSFLDLGEPEHKQEWIQAMQEMFVHTRGSLPEKLLAERRPNEDIALYEYRLSIYEPITMGSINRAIDTLYRIFQNANFSIQVNPDLDDYLSVKKFSGQYFYSYIQKYVVRRMIEDANGLLVWLPFGEGLYNPSEKVQVKPVLVYSSNITQMTDDVITYYQPDEKSIINRGGVEVKGDVYYTLTKTHIYRHTESSKASGKKTFDVEEIYFHNLGMLPAIVLGGNVTEDDFFVSYFSPYLPFANESIRQYSDWQGVMTMSAFPYREEVAEDCDHPRCRGGELLDPETGDISSCSKCGGTGQVINRSPYGVFIRAKSNPALDGNTNLTEPLVRFISPPVDIIKYSGEAWKELLQQAEQSLHLLHVNEAQSGVAKAIDREEQYSFLIKISNNIYDEIIYKSLIIIERYRNLSNPLEPKIIKPVNFTIKTESDLIAEINEMKTKSVPVAFLLETTKDLARKRFSGSTSQARMVEILVSYDPIFHLNTQEKSLLLASGTISKNDILKSLYAYRVLTEILSVQGTNFLENELSTIFDAIDKEIQKYLDAEKGDEPVQIDMTT